MRYQLYTFDESLDVSHAQEFADEGASLKRFQIVDVLASANESDRAFGRSNGAQGTTFTAAEKTTL